MIDRIVLQKEYERVHKFKDEPAKTLGPTHRKVRHDLLTDIVIGIVTKDPKAAVSGILHDYADKKVSSLPKEARAILEMVAEIMS